MLVGESVPVGFGADDDFLAGKKKGLKGKLRKHRKKLLFAAPFLGPLVAAGAASAPAITAAIAIKKGAKVLPGLIAPSKGGEVVEEEAPAEGEEEEAKEPSFKAAKLMQEAAEAAAQEEAKKAAAPGYGKYALIAGGLLVVLVGAYFLMRKA